MNEFVSLFMISRLMILIVIPALFSVTAIFKVISFRKKNGSVIFKKRKINFFLLAMFLSGSLLFLFIIDEDNVIRSTLIYLVAIILFFGSYLEQFIESLEMGIYTAGVVSPGYTAKWDEIEGYINMNPTIRFVHQDKGAFDIRIVPDFFDQCLGQVNRYSVEIP